MLAAFRELCPELPSPVVWAASEEEADLFQRMLKFTQPTLRAGKKVEETIDDTSEQYEEDRDIDRALEQAKNDDLRRSGKPLKSLK
jgi:hypothetical protein